MSRFYPNNNSSLTHYGYDEASMQARRRQLGMFGGFVMVLLAVAALLSRL